MTEPHEIFRPDWGEEIIYVTPNCNLAWDLALRFAPIVSTVLEHRETSTVPKKPDLSGILGHQPKWLS